MSAPTVTVEIAFTSTFSTPEGSRAWTDVTQYVDVDQAAVAIGFGRTDERTTADANSLTLTFDNKDGRFTPEKTTGAYYPNVKLYRPVRITAQYSGGTVRVRYVGYVRSWLPGWSGGSDAMAQVVLSAASRMQRLGIADPLRSVVEEEILIDKPVAYYTLADAAGATSAADSSGNALTGATGPAGLATFGAAGGPATDELTAATFAGNSQGWSNKTYPGFSGAITAECFVNTTSTYSPFGYTYNAISVVWTSGKDVGIAIDVPSAGGKPIAWAAGGSYSVTGPVPVNDGKTHHLAVTLTAGGTLTLYVDGVSAGSTAVGLSNPVAPGLNMGYFPATLAHVAYYDQALSAARIAAHAAAGSSGFAAETTAARLARYASWRGIPAAEVDVINATRTVKHFDPSGMATLDAMRVLEQTESGVLCDSPAGHLRLIGESGRYTAVAAFTLDLAEQYVTADLAPPYDDATLVNDATVTNVGDQSTGRYVNQASIDSYGRAAASPQTASTYADAPSDDAAWLVLRYAEPATRLQSVTITMHSLDALSALRESILAADIGTLVTITNLPAQFSASSGSWFIEGWSETYGPGTHYITLNLSSAAAYLSTFVLDDPVRGLLDSTYTLGH